MAVVGAITLTIPAVIVIFNMDRYIVFTGFPSPLLGIAVLLLMLLIGGFAVMLLLLCQQRIQADYGNHSAMRTWRSSAVSML